MLSEWKNLSLERKVQTVDVFDFNQNATDTTRQNRSIPVKKIQFLLLIDSASSEEWLKSRSTMFLRWMSLIGSTTNFKGMKKCRKMRILVGYQHFDLMNSNLTVSTVPLIHLIAHFSSSLSNHQFVGLHWNFSAMVEFCYVFVRRNWSLTPAVFFTKYDPLLPW